MIKGLLSFLLGLSIILPINSDSTTVELDNLSYWVIDTEEDNKPLGSFKNYNEANTFFENHKGQYGNIAIYHDQQYYRVEYGIVLFRYSNKCDENIEFTNVNNKARNYINGCYGSDGAYITTNQQGTKVQFKIAGVLGNANFSDVTIVPMAMMPANISKYKVVNHTLYHLIKQAFGDVHYSTIIKMGDAPDFMQEDGIYYSYDGHYFYLENQFKEMLLDYQNNVNMHAINDTPYYYFYQYVNHRTISQYDQVDLRNYLEQKGLLKNEMTTYIDANRDSVNDYLTMSQYHDAIDGFFQYQYQYGTNALMMYAVSQNESANGRSSLAYARNNLFGHAAFDSDVEKNAARYLNPNSSIYSHSKYYVSNSYCNPDKFQYHGCFFGDKESGMNVSYASDPYWGEKAAQNYYLFDKENGLLDAQSIDLIVKTTGEKVAVYESPSEDATVVQTLDAQTGYSFIVLDEVGDYYKIQKDGNTSDTIYHFDQNIAYVLKENFLRLQNSSQSKQEKVTVVFDAGEGVFRDGSHVVTYDMIKGQTPSIENPIQKGYAFKGWDKTIQPLNDNESFKAHYEAIESIQMKKMPPTQFEVYDRLLLQGGRIEVLYQNGQKETLPLTTAMVAGYDMSQQGTQSVTVTWNGLTTSYDIHVSQELDDLRVEIIETINQLIEKDSTVEELLALKEKIDRYHVPFVSFETLRAIDAKLYEAFHTNVHYRFESNDTDAQLSGLALSTKLQDGYQKKWIKDTHIVKLSKKNTFEKVSQLLENNGYTAIEGYALTGFDNLSHMTLDGPLLINIQKPEKVSDTMLLTVFLNEKDNLREMYTIQSSERVLFQTDVMGDFILAAKETENTYQKENPVETLTAVKSYNHYYVMMIAVVCTMIMLIEILRRKKHGKITKSHR